jgi:flagellar biosynthesis GTPase FlhF
MRRSVAVLWHASFSAVAAVLFFFFVLPRWYELMGETSHTLGTVLRIVAGALIGLAALPVVFTLLRTRRPEFGTPALALTLRTASIALHVLAGVLIIGTAISEMWLSLDDAGQWLFGIYGAAAAIALLGVFAFYLAFIAELPPPPPKPIRPKEAKQRRGRKAAEAEEAEAEVDEPIQTEDEAPSEETADEEAASDEAGQEPAEVTAAAEEPESTAEEPESTAEEEPQADAEKEAEKPSEAEATNGKLRNRRPSGKTEPTRRRRRRSRGGVAVED